MLRPIIASNELTTAQVTLPSSTIDISTSPDAASIGFHRTSGWSRRTLANVDSMPEPAAYATSLPARSFQPRGRKPSFAQITTASVVS